MEGAIERKRHSSTLSRSLSLFFYHHLQEAKRAVAGIWFAPLTSLMKPLLSSVSAWHYKATLYLVLKSAQTVSDQWQGYPDYSVSARGTASLSADSERTNQGLAGS